MIVLDGYIIAVSEDDGMRDEIIDKIKNKPSAPEGFTYKLKADTLTWELVELPPIEDDTDATESDYIEALQDLGVEV